MITESPLYAVHYAATALGLPCPSLKSVEATVDKVRMREILEASGVPNIRFGRASSEAEAVALSERIGFPLVMKSADVGGQLGLYQITSLAKVTDCFRESMQHAVTKTVIMEEWLQGDEVNVVAVVLDGVIREITVSDRITHPTMAFGIVHRHLYPTKHTGVVAEIRHLCQQLVDAVEIRNAIIFPQIIVSANGPRIIETGERIPGGVMKELFELATGYDLVRLQLDISLGQHQPAASYQTADCHAAVTVKFMNAEPGPLRPGNLAKVTRRDDVLQMAGIIEAQFYNNPNQPQVIRPLRHARDRFYYIIAVGKSREEVIRISNEAADKLDFLDEQGTSLKVRQNEKGW
jgi:biotin carboxylase